eukprot:scaffold229735_cov21-Tisochrysis_lutea.AAC.1
MLVHAVQRRHRLLPWRPMLQHAWPTPPSPLPRGGNKGCTMHAQCAMGVLEAQDSAAIQHLEHLAAQEMGSGLG